MKITRKERIRRALEDLEIIRLCELIVTKEVMYPIQEQVAEIFEEASHKRGYVSGFYRIQNEYNGYDNEDK